MPGARAGAAVAARRTRRRCCSSSATRSRPATASPQGQGWVDLLAEASSTAEGYAYRVVNASISGDTTAGGRARLPALLTQHKPAIVVIELGGNDALRGGSLAATRDNLDAMVAAAQAAGAQVLIVGMQLPPNYGPAYAQEFRELFADVAKARKVPLVPSFFAGFGEDLALFQPDRIHPTADAQPRMLDNVWPELSRCCARNERRGRRRRRAQGRASPRWPRIPTASTCAVPPEFAMTTSPAPSTCRCSTTPSARAVGTMHAQESAFAAKRLGAALVARNIARILETHCRDKPRDWTPLVYCWRGGKRSGSLAHVLNEIGWRAVQLEGGYQAYRRHVVRALAALPQRFRFASSAA